MLGIAAAAGALYLIPVVDQHREISYVTVAPNGGNRESFHINIPADRVMSRAAGSSAAVPAGLVWPRDSQLANVSVELFKVRNERDVIVGVAARSSASSDGDNVIDWMVHLPARGSLFISMDAAAQEGGHRIGQLHAGAQEFANLTGFVAERWVADTSGELDAPAGRIELLANYVSVVDSSADPIDQEEAE